MKKFSLLITLLQVFMVWPSALSQLVITDSKTVTIDFIDFNGTGFAPDPVSGQLDSDTWVITGFSDDDTLYFGDSGTTGDVARGSSNGGVTTGGIYAFDTGSGNIALGFQPCGSDWTPGSIILRIQNNSGKEIIRLDVTYSIFIHNDQGRANSFCFSHSADNIVYTNEKTLNYTSPETADVSLTWIEILKNISLASLNIDNKEYYYIMWEGDDVSGGGSRDEFGLDNISITATFSVNSDTTPPVFSPGFPMAINICETQFDIVMNLDETGTIYCLVQNDGDPDPTRASVRLGETITIFTPFTDFRKTIDTVSPGKSYDIYFLAEDDEEIPNVQDTTILIEVTTKLPASLTLSYPNGGDIFYVGDSIEYVWTSSAIDSVILFIYGFMEKVWFPLTGSHKIDAADGKIKLQIPTFAGPDSTIIKIADARDTTFSDQSGIIYLTDTIIPSIYEIRPKNRAIYVPQNEELILALDETVLPATGNIVIYRKSDNSVFASVDVISDKILNVYNEIQIMPGKLLEPDAEYYILIDSAAFVDLHDNAFRGIKHDTTWTFKTIGPVLFFSEYIEGSTYNKALEIANKTGTDADMSEYVIWKTNSSDDSLTWKSANHYPLDGILKNDSVYVICNEKASDEIKARSNSVGGYLGGATIYNGDDAIGLAKHVDGRLILVDAIGTGGNDPGTAWDVASKHNATSEHTLIRKSYIRTGNIDWQISAGDNAFNSEWKAFRQNYTDNLGMLTLPEDSAAEIISFSVTEQTGPAVIDSDEATVYIEVAPGIPANNLFPSIDVSPGAIIKPASDDSVHFPEGPIFYTVTAENHVHIKVWTVIITIKTTSDEDYLKNHLKNAAILIYPNPTRGSFNIHISPTHIQNFDLQIFSSDAKTLYNRQYRSVNELNEQINLPDISPGIYLIRITSGMSVSMYKLIVY